MKRVKMLLMLAVVLYSRWVWAQEFRREAGTIPVIIKGDTISNAFADLLSGFTAPALADIDKDNDLDLFVGELDGGLNFYRNEGSTARPRLKLAPLVSGAGPIDVGDNNAPTFVDIDNDGDFDLFVGEQRGNINFYRNIGTAANPVFVLEAEELAGIRLDFNSTPAFCDLDSDGDFDLFVGGKDGTVTLYPNTGTPTNFAFTNSVRFFASIDIGSNSAPAFADIDNDRDYDLFVGKSDGSISFYQNNNGAFTEINGNIVDIGDNSTPAFADIDKDGDFDLFVGEQASSSINLYKDTGTPAAPIFTFVTENFASILDLGEDTAPTFADLDNDGDWDWLVGKRDGSITFCRNTGTAAHPAFTLEIENFAAIDIGSNNAPAFADLDNDGDLDLLVGESEGNLNFYRNTGTATNPVFTLETENFGSFDVGSSSAPAFADIDMDGDFDLLVGELDGNINFFRNVGDVAKPLFVLTTEAFFLIDVGNNSVPAFADLDSDGDLDLLVGESAGNLNYYRNTGTATEPAFTIVTENLVFIDVGTNSFPAFVDIDKDGDFDLFVGESGGGMHFYRNITPVGVVVWPGDTNNDGKVDAADVLPIGIHWNKTGPARQNGSCNWVAQLATPWTPLAATYADANGDGVVNQTDVLCIGINWSKTHSALMLLADKTKAVKTLNTANAGNLCYTISGNPGPGREFYVDVQAKNVTNFFGASFDLLYSPNAYVDPQATETGSFLGNDVIFFPNVDKASGKISIGISQKAPQTGVNGSGVIARLKMKMSANASVGQTVAITLQNVTANDPAGAAIAITPAGNCTTIGVEEFTGRENAPTVFALLGNSPNPFNPSTVIKYELPQQVEVKLQIFDLMGRHVRTLVNQSQQAGHYAIIWDGRNEQGQPVASGTFLYQLRAVPSAGSPSAGSGFVQTRRMALVR